MIITELTGLAGDPRGASPIQGWQCWGETSYYIDWGTEDTHLMSAVALDNGEVVCVELFTDTAAWRWIQLEWVKDFLTECQQLGIDTEDSGQGPWNDVVDASEILRILAEQQGHL